MAPGASGEAQLILRSSAEGLWASYAIEYKDGTKLEFTHGPGMDEQFSVPAARCTVTREVWDQGDPETRLAQRFAEQLLAPGTAYRGRDTAEDARDLRTSLSLERERRAASR
jgi:hypothetical protein